MMGQVVEELCGATARVAWVELMEYRRDGWKLSAGTFYRRPLR